MDNSQKDLSYYLSLRYPAELTLCSEGGYFARYPDLPGCATQADTIPDVVAALQEAKQLWLENQLLARETIPEPLPDEPSGRLMLRVPLCLHSTLERNARDLGISLNRLLNEVLFNHANSLPLQYGLCATADRPRMAQQSETHSGHASAQYPITLTACDDDGILAEHLDLPGCAAMGQSALEAVTELALARELWLSQRYKDDLPIPEPLSLDHTGVINLRISSALHYHLARHALRNGVSLNQWLLTALANFAGITHAMERGAEAPAALTQEYANAKTRAAFLHGLRFLNQRLFVNAFESFFDAYRGGLNFSTTAVEIYHSMSDSISPPQLHELLFELTQVVPATTHEKREVHFLLIAWLQQIKDEPRRQEEWLARDREARSAA